MTSSEVWPLLRWWLVVELVGLAALPLATRLLRGLPDRGYSLSKPLGLLLVGYGSWLAATLRRAPLDVPTLVAAAVVVASAGLATLRWQDVRGIAAHVRTEAPRIAVQEALFAAALVAGIALRLHDVGGQGAAITGSEQPMDAALITGILASPSFPPQDPWFASYPINYYYLGHLLVAAVMRLAGVGIGLGYTLGFATVFALTACAVFGLVSNLVRASGGGRGLRGWAGEAAAALLAMGLVLVAGNQAGALQVVAGSEKVVAVPAGDLPRVLANGLGERRPLDLGPAFPAARFDGKRVLEPRDTLRDFDWWWPSRVVWDEELGAGGTRGSVERITEFPFFAFAIGNLHPHMLSMPWILLAAGLALGVAVDAAPRRPASPQGVLGILLAAVVLGALYMINSWDVPLFLALYAGALCLAHVRSEERPAYRRIPRLGAEALATVAAAYLLYLPFHRSFVVPSQGFPLAASPGRTGIVAFVVMFGTFFVPLLAYTSYASRGAAGRHRFVGAGLALAGAAVAVAGPVTGWPLLGLLVLWAWATVAAFRSDERPAAFALMAFGAGALVVWGVDLVAFRDTFGVAARSNMVFKFYYQVWVLWGTLTGFAVWTLLRRRRALANAAWGVPFVLLVAGALVYPLLTMRGRPAGSTLDGLAFLGTARPGVARAAEWIVRNTDGATRILEGPGVSWSPETARLSSITGRPTLIGWVGGHERLWRGADPAMGRMVDMREQEAKRAFQTADWEWTRRLLERYGIRFVFVGPYERGIAAESPAPQEALAKFDRHLRPVVSSADATLYEVGGH